MLIRHTVFLISSAKGSANRARIASYILSNMFHRLVRGSAIQREMKIDFKDLSLIFKTFSSELTSYLEIYLQRVYETAPSFIARPGDIVFDVGANIGVYSIRQASQGAIVYAFEPNHNAFSRLKQNISLNSLKNVILIPKAVHSNSSRVVFSIDPRSTLAGKVVTSEERPSLPNYVNIEAVSLDEFVESIKCPQINILKIDTEGSELEVLQGAAATLAKTGKIVLEYHSLKLKEQVIKTITVNHKFNLVWDLEPHRVLYFTRE